MFYYFRTFERKCQDQSGKAQGIVLDRALLYTTNNNSLHDAYITAHYAVPCNFGDYFVLHNDVNPNYCNYPYFDRSKFTHSYKKQ